MLFFVRREMPEFDDDGDEIQPCNGAEMIDCIRVDERTVDSPSKVEAYKGGVTWWYGEGTNHRVEHGHIKRDKPSRQWAVRITDLEDMLWLHKETGYPIQIERDCYFAEGSNLAITILNG